MDKETVIKVAFTGFVAISTAAHSDEQNASSEISAPRPIEEICNAAAEAEDGIGLDQDILDFFGELEKQGRVLNCDSAYERGNGGHNTTEDSSSIK
jgi:hypothetical protein